MVLLIHLKNLGNDVNRFISLLKTYYYGISGHRFIPSTEACITNDHT